MNNSVYINALSNYDENLINSFNNSLFDVINPDNFVVLKPNWVKESHLDRPDDWEYVITHPKVITSVLMKVIEKLGAKGRIVIADGPQTDSSFKKILAHYPVDVWSKMAEIKGIDFQILDLREDEWINEEDVMVSRKKLQGDPKGNTEVNLIADMSEFHNHKKSRRGYYGADYNLKETNNAHNGYNNLYKVSKTIMEADVFINIPKLKTHKKAGITCCLKNLVGINTYKNYLPHHSEGCPDNFGDQFPANNKNARLEGPIMAFMKQHIIRNILFARMFKPLKKVGKNIFGETNQIIRSGNWYGNDTAWRMILDLNKVLFYANPDGTFRSDEWINAKHYIGIVDAILVGEGNGPMSPDSVRMGYIICGTNPVSIDAVCCKLMGFDYLKIPSIYKAFEVNKYKLTSISIDEIEVFIGKEKYNYFNIPRELLKKIEPHFGWKNHIEIDK